MTDIPPPTIEGVTTDVTVLFPCPACNVKHTGPSTSPFIELAMAQPDDGYWLESRVTCGATGQSFRVLLGY